MTRILERDLTKFKKECKASDFAKMFDEINQEISAPEEFYKKVQPLDVKFQKLHLISEVFSSNRMFLKPESRGRCDRCTANLTL